MRVYIQIIKQLMQSVKISYHGLSPTLVQPTYLFVALRSQINSNQSQIFVTWAPWVGCGNRQGEPYQRRQGITSPHTLSPFNNNNNLGKSPQKKQREIKIVKANIDLRNSLYT